MLASTNMRQNKILVDIDIEVRHGAEVVLAGDNVTMRQCDEQGIRGSNEPPHLATDFSEPSSVSFDVRLMLTNRRSWLERQLHCVPQVALFAVARTYLCIRTQHFFLFLCVVVIRRPNHITVLCTLFW